MTFFYDLKDNTNSKHTLNCDLTKKKQKQKNSLCFMLANNKKYFNKPVICVLWFSLINITAYGKFESSFFN